MTYMLPSPSSAMRLAAENGGLSIYNSNTGRD